MQLHYKMQMEPNHLQHNQLGMEQYYMVYLMVQMDRLHHHVQMVLL